jgi:hypothetical protein
MYIVTMNNFPDQIEAQIRRLEAEEGHLRSQLAELRGRLAGLQEALRMYRGEAPRGAPAYGSKRLHFPASGSRVPDPSRSPGWAAALDAMASAPPQGHRVDYIEAKTIESGHPMARNTLRSVLSHAAREGIIKRVSVGRYRLAESNEPPTSLKEGGSETDGAATPSMEGDRNTLSLNFRSSTPAQPGE